MLRRYYANPFRAVRVVGERQDMGCDYSASGPVYAIGKSRCLGVNTNFYQGLWLVGFVFTAGPLKGIPWYASEHIRFVAGLSPGDHVDRNTVIGHAYGGMEWGFARSDGLEPAASYYYHEGERTVHGYYFDLLMQHLGAPAGKAEGRPVVGHYPSNWPTKFTFRHF